MALKFCANLSMMFTEHETLKARIEAAGKAGFHAFEVAFPYEAPLEDLHDVKEKYKMSLELINTFPGNEGQLGFAALPGREKEFRESLEKAISYAKALKCKRIHVMSGKIFSSKIVDSAMSDIYFENLSLAADLLEEERLIGLIEPINNRTVPGYFMNSFKTEHIQIAQVPDRHEPNTIGELNYKYVLKLLEDLKYDKWIGLEYIPEEDTSKGLSWLEEYGYSRRC
ncbi:putative hydroxypyruvate isomerase isoform X2 [Artemia franciscana]|uniref:putative hydroxypyruvate isomerase isoform X2 n=1 Tax=Artemia franciscana TaxID=6661 RepID=UPI0032DA7762